MVAPTEPEKRRVVAELGSGTGAFTIEIVRRLREDAQLLAFEVDPGYVAELRRRITDPRVTIFHESAVALPDRLHERGLDHVDSIISGLPFATLPSPVADAILTAARDALAPDGVFVAVQYTPLRLELLRRYFPKVGIGGFTVRNIPPALVIVCRKG
jgi:phospholipid N-methyltransferase